MITGASDGIGAAAARRFSAAGAQVVPIGRSPEKTARVADELGVSGEVADFENLEQVRALAARLLERCPTIDVLVNNAGGTFAKRLTTPDGNERTMQVNHLSGYLLTRMLEPRLRHSGVRIVTTASTAAFLGRLRHDSLEDSIQSSGRYVGFSVYCRSKLANILFAAELARRWPEAESMSYHPGAVASQFGRGSGVIGFLFAVPQFRAMVRSPDQGADTMVWLASAPKAAGWYSGGFFTDRRPMRTPRQTGDNQLAGDLWDLSADLVGLPHS